MTGEQGTEGKQMDWHFLDKRSKAIASNGLKLEFASHQDAELGRRVLNALEQRVAEAERERNRQWDDAQKARDLLIEANRLVGIKDEQLANLNRWIEDLRHELQDTQIALMNANTQNLDLQAQLTAAVQERDDLIRAIPPSHDTQEGRGKFRSAVHPTADNGQCPSCYSEGYADAEAKAQRYREALMAAEKDFLGVQATTTVEYDSVALLGQDVFNDCFYAIKRITAALADAAETGA